MKRSVILGLAAAAFAAPASAASLDDVFGLWLVESERAIVDVYPCGERACGKVVWLKAPLNDAGQPVVDAVNPNESLRSRPVCGLEIIGDFTRGGESWDDGFIYDATEGKTYSSTMSAQGDGTLKVRGYVGVPLFGKSQVWTKVSDNRGGC